jgi:signal transduction histidine kinase
MAMIIRFFRGLRGKLILTYTLVTVLALLALEATIIILVLVVTNMGNTNKKGYLSDVVYVLYPQAQGYLQPGHEDIPGLQNWLDSIYASGRASLPPQNISDNPAALIVKGDPMFVISPEGSILAQAPAETNSQVGRQYSPPDGVNTQNILEAAWKGDFNPLDLYTIQPDGTYLMVVPIPQGDRSSQVVAAILVAIEPAPSRIMDYWPMFILLLLGTGLLLLVAVTSFGALFGFIMSRGLTRRLKALTVAVDAWSEGDFTIQPQDKSKDEISYLGRRMRHMAERVQALLEIRHELAMLEERNRLARELHDTVKQENFATVMQVRAARNLLASDPEEAEKHLNEAEDLLKTSQQELGQMINELRPAALEGKGLSDALRNYLDDWSKHSCIPYDLKVENEHRLALETEQILYRVVQEALSNVARHSRGSAVTLRLLYQKQQVLLTIQDNGVGFELQTARKQGFGIQSMQERMSAIGGQVTIETTPGNGTLVTAIVAI